MLGKCLECLEAFLWAAMDRIILRCLFLGHSSVLQPSCGSVCALEKNCISFDSIRMERIAGLLWWLTLAWTLFAVAYVRKGF